METTIVYWGNIGIMENKMEATIMGVHSAQKAKSHSGNFSCNEDGLHTWRVDYIRSHACKAYV